MAAAAVAIDVAVASVAVAVGGYRQVHGVDEAYPSGDDAACDEAYGGGEGEEDHGDDEVASYWEA